MDSINVSVVIVSKSLTSVIGKLVVSAAAWNDVSIIIEVSTGPIYRNRVIINFLGYFQNVQRILFRKCFEDFVFSLFFIHNIN